MIRCKLCGNNHNLDLMYNQNICKECWNNMEDNSCDKPTVSVLILYNSEHYNNWKVKKAIDQIKSQTYHDIEIINVLNTDHYNLSMSNFKLFTEANGKYITIMFIDDEWEDDRIEKLVDAISVNPRALFATSYLYNLYNERLHKPRGVLTNDYLLTNPTDIPINSILFNSQILKESGGIDTFLADFVGYDTAIQMTRNGGVGVCIEDVLLFSDFPIEPDRQADGLMSVYNKHKEDFKKVDKLMPIKIRYLTYKLKRNKL